MTFNFRIYIVWKYIKDLVAKPRFRPLASAKVDTFCYRRMVLKIAFSNILHLSL